MITKPFSETEVRKIEKELSRRTDKIRDLALFRMGVDTMLRTSDLRNLRVQDVLKSEGGIVQRLDVKMKKTGKMVSCVLDEKTQSALQAWLAQSEKAETDSRFGFLDSPFFAFVPESGNFRWRIHLIDNL